MKKIVFIVCCFCGVWFSACKKEDGLGAPATVEPDYVLPQGNASQADNDRIQSLYDTYGSYFLYNITQKDFEWTLGTGSSNSKIDSIVLGNPQYVGDMLDFLNDIWLKFLPEDFKKGQGIPYRVMMVDSIKQNRGPGYPPEYQYLYSDYKVVGKSITFAGMNQSLQTMTPANKLTKKNVLQGVIWGYYLNNGIVDIPDEFYDVSDYTTQPTLPVNASNPANQEAYRTRGFLPGSYTYGPSEWLLGVYFWTNARTYDRDSFIVNVIQRTDAEMEAYLQYPLIKQKFDILVNHFKTKYGIDVRAIANATF